MASGPRNGEGARPATVRCAIYTRKSTEDGLEQEFNSLDAQLEACAAYILSQRHEGWMLASGDYDDGGFSGGTIERPGLKRLLDDVAANRIDCIVVYKIDRLTRSLADFSRIVDVLDKAGASFVSITQAFNTTTSMGRLTLNVLLSFTQFEREVTGERIRDKIAASKARGIWMGGVVPLGYTVRERKLLVDETEAERVRHIFARYLALGSVPALHGELATSGITGKARTTRDGESLPPKPMSRGALYLLLRNPLYVGEVSHKGTTYSGEHEAILMRSIYDDVQARLDANQIDHRLSARVDQPSLLAGFIHDTHGRRMSPSHAVKNKVRRYRYYVSRTDGSDPAVPVWRVPAGELESLVLGRLRSFLVDQSAIHEALEGDRRDATAIHTALFECSALARQLDTGIPSRRREILLRLVTKVTIHAGQVDLVMNSQALHELAGNHETRSIGKSNVPIVVTVAATLARVSKEVKLILPPSTAQAPEPYPGLIKLLVKAHVVRRAIESGCGRTMDEIATSLGHNRDYFGVLLRLSYLAPESVEAILGGRHAAQLNRQTLARLAGLRLDWAGQRRMLEA